MSAQWIAEIIGKMHIHNITQKQLAEHLKITPQYVNMLLAGKKTSAKAQIMLENALCELCEGNHSLKA